MSIANHTQGDWTLHPRLKDVVIVDGDETNWVAMCAHFGKTTAETHANGSLMAGASDLLAAAEGIESCLQVNGGGAICASCRKNNIAAIAKARGQNV